MARITLFLPAGCLFERQFPLKGETQDLKMPAWTPGYYRIMDYAKNVKGFSAEDGAGRPLAWEKTAKNIWRVRAGTASSVVVSYDVYAFSRFCADSYLGDDGGFITPAGVFMHVAGRLKDPVTFTVQSFPGWKRVSTGLDPVPGRPDVHRARLRHPLRLSHTHRDQEVLEFEAAGRPHTVAAYDLGSVTGPRSRATTRRSSRQRPRSWAISPTAATPTSSSAPAAAGSSTLTRRRWPSARPRSKAPVATRAG